MRTKPARAIVPLALAASILAQAAHASAQKKGERPDDSPLACASYFAERMDPEEGMSRDDALVYVARSGWALGKPDRAVRALTKMRCGQRVYASNYLAGEALKAGRKDDARKFIEQSLTCAADEDTYRSGLVFAEFVGKLIELQDYDRALAVADGMEEADENSAARDFVEIVQVYLRAGEPGLASEVARRYKSPAYVEANAVAIADWASEHGRADLGVEALDYALQKVRPMRSEKREEILQEMSDSTAKEKAIYLAEIADRYVAAGQFDRARRAAEAIDLPQWKADKLADVAGAARAAWPRAGVRELLARALHLSKTSAEYPHDIPGDKALVNIARRYAGAGDRETASGLFLIVLEMVRGLEDYEDRVERLAEVGLRFEQAGMKADAPVRNALRRIIKEWTED